MGRASSIDTNRYRERERERGRNYKLINELSPVSERTQRWTGDEWNGKGEIASGTLFLLFLLTSLISRKREKREKNLVHNFASRFVDPYSSLLSIA